MGEDGARGKDWLRARGHHLCLTDTIFYFFHCFSEKIRLDVSSESSAGQRIHLKHQALFSLEDKSKQLKCRLLQFLFV